MMAAVNRPCFSDVEHGRGEGVVVPSSIAKTYGKLPHLTRALSPIPAHVSMLMLSQQLLLD